MPNKLTDAQIRDLYLGFENHYLQCKATTQDQVMIYNQLYYNLWHTLNDVGAPLHHLEEDEKKKAYKVLNTSFYYSPQQISSRRVISRYVCWSGQQLPPDIRILDRTTRYHCGHDNFFLNMILFNTLSSASRTQYVYADSGVTHTHGQSSQGSKKEDDQAKAMLFLVAVGVAIAASALIALFYLMRQMLNSAERFYYNEGWMQASLSMLSMTVSGIATGMLAQALVLSPLIGLAIAAGISNPVGLAVLGVIGIGIVGAAVGCLITNKIQTRYIKNTSVDALNPNDPYRFALTDAEVRTLEENSIDPIKVKCAIVALYQKISELPEQSFCASLFSRRTKEVQSCLDKIRQLRSGKAKQMEIGYNERIGLYRVFDLRKDQEPASALPGSAAGNGNAASHVADVEGGSDFLKVPRSFITSLPAAPPASAPPLAVSQNDSRYEEDPSNPKTTLRF